MDTGYGIDELVTDKLLSEFSRLAFEGGFTCNIFGEHINHGYAVSVFPDVSLQFFTGEINLDVLREWIARNIAILRAGDIYIGGWYDKVDNTIYFDLTGIVHNREYAVELGREYNQVGVYAIHSAEFIPTDGDGTNGGYYLPFEERLKQLRTKRASKRDY